MHLTLPLPLLISSLLLLLVNLPPTTPLGINCRGSLECNPDWNTYLPESVSIITAFHTALTTGHSFFIPGGPIPDTHIFHSGEHIACLAAGHLCLFMQGNVPGAGVSGAVVKQRVAELVAHECVYCGSVPLSGNNNPGVMGILTSNFVTGTVCNGVCAHS